MVGRRHATVTPRYREREREFERKSEGAKKGSTNHALLPATVASEDDDPTVVELPRLPATNLCRGWAEIDHGWVDFGARTAGHSVKIMLAR